MPSTAHRPATALVASVCALLAAAVLSAPVVLAQPSQTTTPTSSSPSASCQDRSIPPPAVDMSEQPKPGKTAPGPLPVPAKPVGGSRLYDCGVITPSGAPAPPGPNLLNAQSWVVADLNSGAIIAAKDPHARHRPASIIKVLTALVALKELDPSTVIVGEKADTEQEGSKVGVGVGGKYTVKDLITGMMLDSGNDAAHALARKLGGVDETVRKMNQLARQLGALDTRAATPSGLDGPGMSTSAYDQAVIFKAALKNPEIAKAVATKSFNFPGYGNKPAFKVSNDNQLLALYTGALGGKTGFTDDARHTFIGAAEKGGRRLVAVLIRAEKIGAQSVYTQAAKLLDYGYSVKAASEPVGQLVERAPAETAASGDGGAAQAKQDGNGGITAPENPSAAAVTPFGNVGLPLTIAAGVFVIIFAFLYVRKKRAKAAARARAAAAAV
ncbi:MULTISPECIES: D-alanyl-D-alanine carboxypeptidase family protein [unclassified Crossiella]|uniref:D-alanyl-D-alanine carboxypeptidase family protein n=1 Tax=unclassified Crossiella TaxID=2620835 RepID=UPI001FFFDEDA|nr:MULTISPECIES: D-alanyl-D-alanine carboxypeptidase family protein [unclassified Crossiella]MCK2238293.1 D-alanyl-D-alanine carboxypeptidase [Crossiella sp. S99.2]MCK2256333.1 D-alanyl-D-alanine carboxypeptidase [Crossiella sp. S99.1]